MSRRLLLDFRAANTGGQLSRARAFLARLRRYDPDCYVVALQENGTLETELRAAGAETVDFRAKGAVGPGKLRAVRRMLWLNASLPALMRERGLDTYLSFSHFLPWTLPRGVLSVVGVSNLAPFSGAAVRAEVEMLPRIRLAVLKRTIVSAARRADHVIALSHACRKTLERHAIDAAKIVVIPNGVDPCPPVPESSRAAIRERFGIVGDFILYVSHFYRYKNFERLVDAYGDLSAELAVRYPLVLVGRPYDQRYYDEVSTRVRALPSTHRVTMIPGLDANELRALYAECALFVFPSLVENSPNILLEAMACGAPVLAGEIEPMPEFGGAAARYFDPLSTASLRDALAATLNDVSVRIGMRAASRAGAAHYTWDAFTDGVVALYSKDSPRAARRSPR